MDNKRVLITGAAGFVGSNLCLELQKQDYEVIALDIFSKGSKRNLSGFDGKIIDGDIRDFDWKREKVDAIIHEGAITDTTIKDREKMFSVNFQAFKKIIEYCKQNRTNLVYASSASVYGRGKIPMQEEQEKDILSYYAESKLEMDIFASENLSLFEERELKLVGLRYFNVYGPREMYKGKMASMIYQLCLQMKSGQKPKVFKYGEQTRDFVYIQDVINATILALNAKKNGVYNIGSGKSSSFNKIIKELNKNLNTELNPEYINNPYSHYQNHTLADISNAQKFLNYHPEYSIEKGIVDYIKFLEKKE
ncbi:MAG: ADP-glyceromanno-heptose 6-epimerase [Nanoarchaeota archaeon]|nr:ADP-glyceromanno-heptose 6-epimerase [Nanoarchaeota archaeon]